MILDMLMMAEQAATGVWTPAQLFQNGEVGFWLDASDLSTLFQDQMGVTPVTASGDQVGLWKNKVGQTNYNFYQSTTANRPKYNLSGGKSTVVLDGVDDSLSSIIGTGSLVWPEGCTICMGQTKTQVGQSAGLKALYGASSLQVTIQNQAGSSGQPGGIYAQMFAQTVASTELISATTPNIITAYAKKTTQPLTVRVNGISKSGSAPTSDGISQTYTFPGSPTNQCSFSQMVLINRLLTTDELTKLEAFIGSKQ